MPLPQEIRYSYADVLAWDESERIELIYGFPVMMAPPARIHQRTIRELVLQLGNYLKGKTCEVYPAPFGVRLFEQQTDLPEDVDTLVEPDISVICDPSKLDDAGCKGAPDMIIEVLSPSTQHHDRSTKFDLYQLAGVREYWIIDPAAKIVQVHILEDGKYHAATVYTAGMTVPVAVLDGCSIDLSAIFPPDP